MAGFQSFKPSFSFIDTEQNMELLNQYSIHYDNQNMSSQSFLGFSNDNFLSQQVLPPFDHQYMQCFQPDFQHEQKNVMVIPDPTFTSPVHNGKRKSMDVSSSSTGNSSSHPVQESETDEKKYQVFIFTTISVFCYKEGSNL
ncbi:hypothetical protein Hdeb2414_s0009g00325131 [Helianthus debilis subsp. tardiflorus]